MSKFTVMGCMVAGLELGLGIWQLLVRDYIVAFTCAGFGIVSLALVILVNRSQPR